MAIDHNRRFQAQFQGLVPMGGLDMRFIAAGMILLATAASAWAGVESPTGPSPSVPAPPPLGVWRPDGSGGLEHVQSGMVCPERLGDRVRQRVELFDRYGLDVGCDYRGPASTATYYLTRRTSDNVDDAMTEAKRELVQLHAAQHPRLLSDTRRQDEGQAWTEALYLSDNGVADAIWITDVGGWTLEYRITDRPEDHPSVAAELKAQAAALSASIRPRLEACAKAVAAERAGRRITDKAALDSATMMTSILGGTMQTEAVKSDAGPHSTFRCPDQPIVREGIPMLSWRHIRPDGSDTLTDELSVETKDGPLTMSFSSGLSALIALGSKQADQPPQWSATVQKDGRTLIFGYFAGRPTIQDMSGLFADALTGKARAIGGYSAKGNAVIINSPTK